MDAELIVVGGKASKRTIKLKLPMIIGRGHHARLKIAHPMVSRRHVELFEREGLLMVRDLGSLNGTHIDGQRIQEAPLPPEAEFSIGPLTFKAQYRYQGDLTKLPAAIPDTRPTRMPEQVPPSGDTGEPDFEAMLEAEILESEPVAEPVPKSEKPQAAKPAKATVPTGETVEKRLDQTSHGVKPAAPAPAKKKPTEDAFDDLLSDFD